LARKERFSLPQALHLLELLGQALAFGHRQGAVHQCLNPLNILLAAEDLRLANFAFAPAFGDQPLHLELKAYAPPELIQGERLTAAGNVFSLGVLGFRLVAGSLPYALTFDEPFPYRLEYPPVDLEEIPVPLQNVLLQCLSEDPEERLPDAGAFIDQLGQARELMHGVSKKPYAAWRPERPRLSWQPLAQAGPRLKKIWEDNKPHAQKAKDAALAHLSILKQAPRRLWWGAGLAVLMVVLIIVGVKIGSRTWSQSQPTTVAAPVKLPMVGGGPPLMETGAARGAPARATPGHAPAPVLATSAGTTRGSQNERYMVVAATYGNLKPAQALQQRLRAKHLHAVIIVQKTSGKTLYQVRVGPITGAKAADDAAQRIRAQEKVAPKVVKLANPKNRR
jgi:cell division septation protein DedD